MPPFGEKRIARSPMSSVRSQIAHDRSTVTLVTLVIANRVTRGYAGTASRSFFAASISFWAMCAGTSS